MANAIDEIRTYLRDVIGTGAGVDGTNRANAIIEEGVESVAGFGDLHPETGIKTVCSNVRKPSGMMPMPGWQPPVPNPLNLVAPVVPNPGMSLSAVCEQRLHLAAYGARIYNQVGRTITPQSLNRARLRAFREHQIMIETHKDAKSLPELSKSFTIMKFLDQLPTYLANILGAKKVALSYIIRENIARPLALPPLEVDEPFSVGKEDLMEELVAYTQHRGPTYKADNARLFSILSNHLAGTSALASISRHQRSENGRAAYFDLVKHHLGSAKWEKTVEVAERLLTTRLWNGRNSRYTLRFHINKHREAFNDLKRAEEHINYVAPTEPSRARHLLQSLQTTESAITSAKTTIQDNPVRRNDFEAAADFLLITAPDPKTVVKPPHQISAASTSNRNRGGTKRGYGKTQTGPKTGVEVRFYQKDEWRKLSQDERDECVSIRKAQTKKRQKTNNANDGNEAISMLKTQIDQLVASLQTNNTKKDSLTNNGESQPEKDSALKPPKGFAQRALQEKE